ncbi:MAG: hypothetical protein IKC36_02685 [Clostridia bacterium]|nr:hypothetical protein [Clostridia bacterium]
MTIGLARVNDTTQKRAKVCFVFTWVMAAVGVIMLVLGIIFSMLPFTASATAKGLPHEKTS